MFCNEPVTKQAWPSGIILNRRGRTLDIAWNDDAPVPVSHAALRAACRCTQCESARRQSGAALPAAPDVEIDKVEPVGSVGLQIFFSDGHNRGIYPWPYLREIAHGKAVLPATD